MPTSAPKKELTRRMKRRDFHPQKAPSMASNLMSPPPMPFELHYLTNQISSFSLIYFVIYQEYPIGVRF
jgi:hypothetical protein